ncbi:MAG: hypothetical protein AVDCRST_MAG31-761, partial [uncultured Sphingomonas sp.]
AGSAGTRTPRPLPGSHFQRLRVARLAPAQRRREPPACRADLCGRRRFERIRPRDGCAPGPGRRQRGARRAAGGGAGGGRRGGPARRRAGAGGADRRGPSRAGGGAGGGRDPALRADRRMDEHRGRAGAWPLLGRAGGGLFPADRHQRQGRGLRHARGAQALCTAGVRDGGQHGLGGERDPARLSHGLCRLQGGGAEHGPVLEPGAAPRRARPPGQGRHRHALCGRHADLEPRRQLQRAHAAHGADRRSGDRGERAGVDLAAPQGGTAGRVEGAGGGHRAPLVPRPGRAGVGQRAALGAGGRAAGPGEFGGAPSADARDRQGRRRRARADQARGCGEAADAGAAL